MRRAIPFVTLLQTLWFVSSRNQESTLMQDKENNLTKMKNLHWMGVIITAHIRRMGTVMFLVCSHRGGLPHLHLHSIILPLAPCPLLVGVPHLHPIILPLAPLPLAPCAFWEYPSDWSQVPSLGGTPVTGRGTSAITGWNTLIQDMMGYPLSKTGWGMPPSPGQVLLGQVTVRAVRLLRFPIGGWSCYEETSRMFLKEFCQSFDVSGLFPELFWTDVVEIINLL